MSISVEQQCHAAIVTSLCTRLLDLDAIWTTQLEAPTASPGEIAGVGERMMDALDALKEESSFLGKYAALLHAEGDERGPSFRELAKYLYVAAEHIHSHADEEMQILTQKAAQPAEGAFPEGDLTKMMRAAIAVAAGVLIVAGSTLALPAAVTVASAALGGGLIAAGLTTLLA